MKECFDYLEKEYIKYMTGKITSEQYSKILDQWRKKYKNLLNSQKKTIEC